MYTTPQKRDQFQHQKGIIFSHSNSLKIPNISNQIQHSTTMPRNRLFSGNSTETNTPENSEFDDHDVYGFNPSNKLNHQNYNANQDSHVQIEVKPKKKNFANLEEKRKFIQEYTKKQKTELCKNWETVGQCKFGDKCSFAHGQDQLKEKNHLHSNYKTKPCKKYFQNGFCSYGNRCQYLHHDLLYVSHYKDYAQNIYRQKDLYLPQYEKYGDYTYRWQKLRKLLNQRLKEKNMEPIPSKMKRRLPIFQEISKAFQNPEQCSETLQKNPSQESLQLNNTIDSLNSSFLIPKVFSNTSISQIDPQDISQSQDDVNSIKGYMQASQNQQNQKLNQQEKIFNNQENQLPLINENSEITSKNNNINQCLVNNNNGLIYKNQSGSKSLNALPILTNKNLQSSNNDINIYQQNQVSTDNFLNNSNLQLNQIKNVNNLSQLLPLQQQAQQLQQLQQLQQYQDTNMQNLQNFQNLANICNTGSYYQQQQQNMSKTYLDNDNYYDQQQQYYQ